MTKKTVGPVKTGFLFGTSAFGLGMLYLPAVFNQIGYMGAFLTILMLFGLSWLSLYFLNITDEAIDPEKNHEYSYYAAFISSKTKKIVEICFILSNFTVVYLFLRRASDLTVSLIKFWFVVAEPYYIRMAILTFYAITCYLLFLKEDLSALKFLSYLSLSSAIFYSLLMIVCGMYSEITLGEMKAFNNYKGVDAFSNLIFAAHCQFAFLAFKGNLTVKNRRNGLIMATIGLLVTYGIYTTVGIFGYKYLGKSVEDKYILELVVDNLRNNVLIDKNKAMCSRSMSYCLALLTGMFVIIFYAGIPLTAFTFIPVIQKFTDDSNFKMSRIQSASIVAILMYLVAIPIELNEGFLLGIISAICTNFLSFGFPGLYGMKFGSTALEKRAGCCLLIISCLIGIGKIGLLLYETIQNKQ
ncbi:transmembrane amino acid transporter [Nucleospora cyclopteri]